MEDDGSRLPTDPGDGSRIPGPPWWDEPDEALKPGPLSAYPRLRAVAIDTDAVRRLREIVQSVPPQALALWTMMALGALAAAIL